MFPEQWGATKQIELTGSATQPIQSVQMSLDDWDKQRAKQQAELEKTMSLFEEVS